MNTPARCIFFLSLIIPVTLVNKANANIIGDTLGWQYYAYGGPYTYGSGYAGTFVTNGAGSTVVNGVFTDPEYTYFNIITTPTSITFNYSVDTYGTANWASSKLSLAPTIYNGIAINLLSGSPFTSVKIDPSTNMQGFNNSDLSFTKNQIQVNWANLPFSPSTQVKLNVNTGQTVFLDFGADNAAHFNLDGLLSNTNIVYSKPAYDGNIDQVVSEVKASTAGIMLILLQQGHLPDAKLEIVLPGDDDTGISEEILGTIAPNTDEYYNIPEFAGEKIILDGSSSEGGTTNIFAGGPGGIAGDSSDPNTFAFQLFDNKGNLIVPTLAFYQEGPGGYASIGSANVSASISAVPLPNAFITLLSGMFILIGLSRWQQSRPFVQHY